MIQGPSSQMNLADSILSKLIRRGSRKSKARKTPAMKTRMSARFACTLASRGGYTGKSLCSSKERHEADIIALTSSGGRKKKEKSSAGGQFNVLRWRRKRKWRPSTVKEQAAAQKRERTYGGSFTTFGGGGERGGTRNAGNTTTWGKGKGGGTRTRGPAVKLNVRRGTRKRKDMRNAASRGKKRKSVLRPHLK